MKKDVELLQTLDAEKLYEQFSRAVMAVFKCIKEMPKLPKHYSTFIVALSALKIGRRNIYGSSITFGAYTDGKGSKEVIVTDGKDAAEPVTFEDLVKSIERMKKKFKYEHIDLSVKHDLSLSDIAKGVHHG